MPSVRAESHQRAPLYNALADPFNVLKTLLPCLLRENPNGRCAVFDWGEKRCKWIWRAPKVARLRLLASR